MFFNNMNQHMHHNAHNAHNSHNAHSGPRNRGYTKHVYRNGTHYVYTSGSNIFDDDDEDESPFVFRRGNNRVRVERQEQGSMIMSCIGQLFSLFLVFVFFVLPYFPTRY
jgi:hypothetical protein